MNQCDINPFGLFKDECISTITSISSQSVPQIGHTTFDTTVNTITFQNALSEAPLL